MRRLVLVLIIALSLPLAAVTDSSILRTGFARLAYDGGGDWYNDPEVLPNLASFMNRELGTNFPTEQATLRAHEAKLFEYPFVYLTGHGNIRFSEREVDNLRLWMERGGFLYADDDYGMDESFRREIKRIFPQREMIELDPGFPMYKCYYQFDATPKIHLHDEKAPQAFGIFDDNGRLMMLYTYETNISDGWADASTHHDPPELREQALRFGANIVYYLLTR